MGLACPSSQPSGERQRLTGVAGGLVDPPGREVGRPRTQKNRAPAGCDAGAAGLLDGARDQWDRLVSPAGEGVGGAEGRGGERCPDDELPRPAELEAPLEDPRRAREIPATEVGAAKIEQPKDSVKG